MKDYCLCPCCGSPHTAMMIDDLTLYKIITCYCCGNVDMLPEEQNVNEQTKGN